MSEQLTIGSLCSGYLDGGLDLAVEQHFGAETRWFCEFEEAPSRVLEAHWPGVPNHGDMTKVDWASAEPVDIICGGTPCQDLSAAGARKGMTEGTRSNLWVQMREAIAVIRPRVVVWENVRGAYSARADSSVESEPGLLGVGDGRPALRALGRVLGDLSELGFDAEWVGVRASDAGAPHGRFRVFVVAHAHGSRLESFGRVEPVESDVDRRGGEGTTRADRQPSAPAPDAGTWGPYAPAIARWEAVMGRPAPAPTLPDGKGGKHRLNAALVEWMMGQPEGWVTGVPGLTRNQMLRMLGNGVVTQQARLALSIAWPRLADVREQVAA